MPISALRTRLTAALLDFAWDEWAQMGVFAATSASSRWVQDPEALLLLTLEVGRDDPRLFDEVLDWWLRNEALVSVRRLRGLCRDPADKQLATAGTEWVARRTRPSAQPNKQRREDPSEAEPLFRQANFTTPETDPAFSASGLTRPPLRPSGKSRQPDPAAPINFAFRLRHLLGVGTRAEAVRYLLTVGESATVADVAASSGYAKRNIQEALSSLHAANVVTATTVGGEQRFAADRARWSYLLSLESDEIPPYRDWPRLLGVTRRILRWLMQPGLDDLSEYMRTSRAADLLDEVRPEINRAGVTLPARPSGPRTWSELENTIETVIFWLAPSRPAERPAVLHIVGDAASGYRWRLTASNGRVIATSAEAYKSARAARVAAERLREASERFSLRVMPDAGIYRWNIVAENGRILGVSGESFATQPDAKRAARVARGLIADAAPPVDNPSTAVDRARRHVMFRPDGRWEVRAEGATRAASTHATQADAMRAARRQVHDTRSGGEVIVHARDGRIRSVDVVLGTR